MFLISSLACTIAVILLSLLLLTFIPPAQGQCKTPPPSSNFTLDGYYGLWYEIGKIQTAGGAFFEKDCVCTTIDIQPNTGGTKGESTAINSCRKNTPQGEFLNATGHLVDMMRPGQWKEKFFPFTPKVNYTVIYLDQDFAVEYDCSNFLGLSTNYCIHIMARSPCPDPSLVDKMVKFSLSLGLNTQNLPFHWTQQVTCW